MSVGEAVEPQAVEVRIDERKAAAHIGVTLWMLQEMCRRGELPFGKLGRKRYFYTSQLDQWLRDRVVIPKASRK